MEKTETLLIEYTDGTMDEIPLTAEELFILQRSAKSQGMKFDDFILKLLDDFVHKPVE